MAIATAGLHARPLPVFLSLLALVLTAAAIALSGVAGSELGGTPFPHSHIAVLQGALLCAALLAGLGALLLFQRWRRQWAQSVAEHGRLGSALAQSRDFERLFRAAGDPMLILDPERGGILDLNHVASEVFDAPREMFLGRSLDTVLSNTGDLQTRIRDAAAEGQPQDFEIAHHAGGRKIHLHVSASRIAFCGSPAVLCVFRDVSERKAMEQQLTQQAFYDPLTGLANRVLFRDRVEHAVAHLKRNPHPVIVMFLDLDNFKNVNDSLGHAAGDELLVQVAKRILRCVRMTDSAARLGGDEFAILIEQTARIEDAIEVAERIKEELTQPFTLEGTEVFVGTSIGIASTTGGDTAEELLRNADAGMYIAKGKGRGCYEVYDPAIRGDVVERLSLESDLRRALARGEFFLEYQPIMHFGTGRFTAAEALVRWNHPDRGRIAPGAFIPLAEEIGLIGALGQWVIEEACRQARRWLDDVPDHPLSVSVNVSGKQMHRLDPDLFAVIEGALARSGLPARQLVVEITESVMICREEATLELLRRIRQLGVRIALDDFGTGYSSLGYLHRFPVDIVKIDRTFTEGLDGSPDAAQVARAIVALGSALNLETVAEGVGTEQQAAKLREMGCDMGQGFHLARPVGAAHIDTLLRQQSDRPGRVLKLAC